MGRQTNRLTADEIEEGHNLREQFRDEIGGDIEYLNNAQLERLDRLRGFIGQGLVDIRVRAPEEGYFHAKGGCFRAVPEEEDNQECPLRRRGAPTP